MYAEFIWKVHGYTNEYIRFADSKAAAVIAWCATLIGVLFSLKAHQRFMQAGAWSGLDPWATGLATCSLLAFVLLSLSAAASFWCVKPRLWSKLGGKGHNPGYVYWEQISAHRQPDVFKSELARQTSEQLAEHCADHVFVIAGIVKRKYRWVEWGIWLAMFGSFFAAATLLFVR